MRSKFLVLNLFLLVLLVCLASSVPLKCIGENSGWRRNFIWDLNDRETISNTFTFIEDVYLVLDNKDNYLSKIIMKSGVFE